MDVVNGGELSPKSRETFKFWEHIANTLTHGIMIPPSIVGIMWMVQRSANDIQYKASLIYGLPLLGIFCCSAFYHLMASVYSSDSTPRRLLCVLKVADRTAIFIFIAASYSPWLVLNDYGAVGINMLYAIWIVAISGIVYHIVIPIRYPRLESLLYVAMGLCPAMVLVFFADDYNGLVLMAAGGAAYISGLFFFHAEGRIPFAHAFWHMHVVLGAVLHFIAVMLNLIGSEKGGMLMANEYGSVHSTFSHNEALEL